MYEGPSESELVRSFHCAQIVAQLEASRVLDTLIHRSCPANREATRHTYKRAWYCIGIGIKSLNSDLVKRERGRGIFFGERTKECRAKRANRASTDEISIAHYSILSSPLINRLAE